MIRRYVVSMVVVATLVSAAAASGPPALPAPLQEAQPALQFMGTATLRWFGIHVYDVTLFAAERPYSSNVTAALTIRYDVAIKRQRLLDTTIKEWQRMGRGDETQRVEWIRQLETLWPDIKAGESLTALRLREGPTRFYFGDKLLGEVADPAFGPAFLAIWLDAKSRHPDIRDALLGAKKDGKKDGKKDP